MCLTKQMEFNRGVNGKDGVIVYKGQNRQANLQKRKIKI